MLYNNQNYFRPHRNTKDLKGLTVGKLTVIRAVSSYRDRHTVWLCLCECGNYTEVQSNNLQREKPVRSCGCLQGKKNLIN